MLRRLLSSVFESLASDADDGTPAWPRVVGRVVGSDVQAAWLMRGLYRARITVVYEVDGVRHVARRVSVNGVFGDSFDRALAETLRHPIGSAAEVMYDPAQPETAFVALDEHLSATTPSPAPSPAGS